MAFQWGFNDCALFSADAVYVQTGVDLAKGMRNYKTERGAARVIRKAGGMTALAKGLVGKQIGLVQYGEVVLADIESRETFGIALHTCWCAPGADGLVFRPMSDVRCAYGF